MVNNIAPYQIDTNSVGVQIRADLAPSTITLTLHRGRVNYLFADEHPKAFAFDDPEVSGSGTLTSPYGAGTVYLNDCCQLGARAELTPQMAVRRPDQQQNVTLFLRGPERAGRHRLPSVG